jgi:hydroxymethylpyrimidine kinase/phosphomethylpyrimidine kinase
MSRGLDMTTFFDEEPERKRHLPQQGLRTALSVGGLDPSGGAGIIADVRAFDALEVYPMAAVATVTYQNTLGVQGRFDLPADVVVEQVREIFADRAPNAVKVGALGTADTVRELGLFLKEYAGPVVIDPVVLSTSGERLLDEDGAAALVEYMMPGAAILTPNASEAEYLSGFEVFDIKDLEAAALRLIGMGARSALITGKKVRREGATFSADVFCDGSRVEVYMSPWVEGLEVHGSGCVLSSAVAACLARGMTLNGAVQRALALARAAVEAPVHPGTGMACADPFALRARPEQGDARLQAGETP